MIIAPERGRRPGAHAASADAGQPLQRYDDSCPFGPGSEAQLQRLQTAHGDPPYSFAIESMGSSTSAAPFLHWRLRIVPDLVNWGGFERGSGMPINPSAPEADAALLRAASVEGN